MSQNKEETYTLVRYDYASFLVPNSKVTLQYRGWMERANLIGTPESGMLYTANRVITETEAKGKWPRRVKGKSAMVIHDDDFRIVAPSKEAADINWDMLHRASALFETLPYDGTWDVSLEFEHTGKFANPRYHAKFGTLRTPVTITHMYEWKFNI